MGQIVLGRRTSHTSMLLVDTNDLPRYEENDRRLTLLDLDGEPTSFHALTAPGIHCFESDNRSTPIIAPRPGDGRIGRSTTSVRRTRLPRSCVSRDNQSRRIYARLAEA